MKPSKIVAIVTSIVLLVVFVSVLLAAMGIGGEASTLDSLLKTDVNTHVTVDALNKQMAEQNLTIVQPGAPSVHALATGPQHRALIYKTWLTLDISVDQNGLVNGYHLDRASGWF